MKKMLVKIMNRLRRKTAVWEDREHGYFCTHCGRRVNNPAFHDNCPTCGCNMVGIVRWHK